MRCLVALVSERVWFLRGVSRPQFRAQKTGDEFLGKQSGAFVHPGWFETKVGTSNSHKSRLKPNFVHDSKLRRLGRLFFIFEQIHACALLCGK